MGPVFPHRGTTRWICRWIKVADAVKIGPAGPFVLAQQALKVLGMTNFFITKASARLLGFDAGRQAVKSCEFEYDPFVPESDNLDALIQSAIDAEARGRDSSGLAGILNQMPPQLWGVYDAGVSAGVADLARPRLDREIERAQEVSLL